MFQSGLSVSIPIFNFDIQFSMFCSWLGRTFGIITFAFG